MTNVIQISRAEREKACVVALHCSLGSGRQWKTLADELGAASVLRPRYLGLRRQHVRAGPAADARGRSPMPERHAQRRGGTDPSRRPFLWRRDCVQDRDRLGVRASCAQPDADRAGAADAAVRERRGPAASRAFRAGRARGFRGHLEWIGAGGDRQVHRVLERVRSAGSAAGRRAPAHDRARRQACVRFHGGVRRGKCRDRGGLASRSDAVVFGRAVALSHPAHRAAARRDHGRRRNPAFAGRRPYAAAHPCVVSQSRDRAAYRPRGRTRRRSAGGRSRRRRRPSAWRQA